MKFSEVKKIADSFQGWLTNDEAELLFSVSSKLKNKGVIVEIGSFKGKSTAYIGNGAKLSGINKIYCVDPHNGGESLSIKLGKYNSFEEFQYNCRKSKVDDIVIPLVDISENVVKTFKEDIEFIFIDGDHSYEAVLLDFELWNPKLLNGGIIAFHDTNQKGVQKVVWDNILNSLSFRNAGRAGTIIFAEKVEKNSPIDRLHNKLVFFSLKKFLFVRKLKKSIPNSVKKILKGKK
jgi:predicted O-methyltransferase YrrM